MVKEYVTNSTSALVSASSALNGSPQATESTRQLSMQVERMIIEDSDDDFQCEEPASLGSAVKQDFPAIVASKYNINDIVILNSCHKYKCIVYFKNRF